MAELRANAGGEHLELCVQQLSIVKRLRLPSGIIFRAADFCSLISIPLAGSLLRQTTENLQRNLYFWTLLAVFTIVLVGSHGGYRPLQGHVIRKQTGLAINCFIATCIAMLSMSILLGHGHIVMRRWTLADLFVTPFVIGYARSKLAIYLASSQSVDGPSGPLVICYDRYPEDLIGAMQDLHISGVPSAVFYLALPDAPHIKTTINALTDPVHVINVIRDHHIKDVVFVHHPELDRVAATVHQQLLSDILAYPVRIWLALDIAPNLPELLKGHTGTCRIVPIVSDELISSVNLAKRILDLVLSLVLLICFSPVLLVAAALVRASGRGPIIFRQTRTGAHGKRFTVFKFRTMREDANRSFAQASVNDPRVTKVGRFLRRTSLDELLQLFNVIRGDMSLVGPRPHAPETEVEGINFENAVKLYRLRHRVKPGITGLAQIRGQRGETRVISMLEQRLASDLEYIQSWSLWLDISILLQTLPVMLAQTNAW